MSKKLTIDIPEELLREIDMYCKSSKKESTSKAVIDLLKSALTLPEYFRNFNWEEAEKEADDEIKSGKTSSFDSLKDFLADLKS